MNRQGTLGDFIDVAGGSGTSLEPRKRQVYTSKRLQELVSAHRQEQKRKADDANDSQNADATKKGSAKRARNKKRNGDGAAITDERASVSPTDENNDVRTQEPRSLKSKRGAGSRGRGRGRRNKARGGSRSQAGGSRKVVDTNPSEDEFVPASVDAAPAREIKLRARPKPKPKTSVNSPTKERAPQESSSDSGSEFEDT